MRKNTQETRPKIEFSSDLAFLMHAKEHDYSSPNFLDNFTEYIQENHPSTIYSFNARYAESLSKDKLLSAFSLAYLEITFEMEEVSRSDIESTDQYLMENYTMPIYRFLDQLPKATDRRINDRNNVYQLSKFILLVNGLERINDCREFEEYANIMIPLYEG